MIKIYSPENVMEAQCLKDFLEQQRINCFIGGQYLAGAIGELPVTGLLGLYVEEIDAELAKSLICDYLSATPVFHSK
ncbi:hypothetical protein GZ77_04570 [Endozoicomonas montiporae]|uniref:DUF2007 domain-containing protein n=2 Tax=Endozoicomonas montiporae TaxID=1027273 RepID=A0A081NBI8_9GAMM|nr:DUF2007 domain-containing protein [Endozoicomonas montiporae]AMO56095.1 hypothetical protein EZMO1_1966 [Endozoicomonas montiporae CL-33]KEQ15811.1 hypothetical protein GZ77_04570 [Endozoicomonas montiporae]